MTRTHPYDLDLAVLDRSVQTVVCMKWGDAFPAYYVNRLYASVMRNVERPTRFILFTDDGTGVNPDVEIRALPKIDLPIAGMRRGPWKKLGLWSRNIGLHGDVLFLDLDVVVTGSLDALFDYRPGKFCIIQNWTQKKDGIGNSSVMRFAAGSAPHLVDDFEKNAAALSFQYVNEQIYVTRASRLDTNFWPENWMPSFKHTLLPMWPSRFWRDVQFPINARIVVFTGDPRPIDAIAGRWPVKSRFKKMYKYFRPVKWVESFWIE